MADQNYPPLVDRIKTIAMNIQFLWFVGHLTTVSQAIFSLIYSGTWNYYKAFYGTLISYAIILYKSHGVPQLNKDFLAKTLQDENAQYFLVALVWSTAAPIKVALIPFATFSLFHSMGYIRSEFIPKVFPGNTLPQSKVVASGINSFMTKYQAQAITYVAYSEVWVILPMTIITIFWGGTSFFTPIMYSQFLQFRYLSSPITREVFTTSELTLDKYLDTETISPTVRNGYLKVKEVIKRYVNLQTPAPPVPPSN
ncbi:hypothetical protein BC833DRAFT_572694 [Globomyces pollinis-pini]|nr:hypothetical protein BC833DRAFT_572694 [Globomyces pollinis-pini]KAJ2999945.1 hypothetical protein HDV02_001202 [Globomyces sp. JEL0801]